MISYQANLDKLGEFSSRVAVGCVGQRLKVRRSGQGVNNDRCPVRPVAVFSLLLIFDDTEGGSARSAELNESVEDSGQEEEQDSPHPEGLQLQAHGFLDRPSLHQVSIQIVMVGGGCVVAPGLLGDLFQVLAHGVPHLFHKHCQNYYLPRK